MMQSEILGYLFIIIIVSALFAVYVYHRNNDDDFNF